MQTQLNLTQPESPARPSLMRLIWIAPLAMLASTVANLGLYAAAGTLYPEVTAWAGASQAQVIGASIVYLLIGTVTFAIIAAKSARPVRRFIQIATIGLLLSLVMPITAGMGYGPPNVPPAELTTVVTLSLMHVLSYAISVPLFIRTGLEQSAG